ncbi:MAG: four helix bundle protein [Acidobacteriaceae bacterium]|jgi:four helix bundle protein
MALVESFRELTVWQRAIELSVAVYRMTAVFPKEEMYGLTCQIRRASVSVASNIAEGQGRCSPGEFRQFPGMARGSNLELQTHLVIAERLGYGVASSIAECEGLSFEVGRMLNGLMKTL